MMPPEQKKDFERVPLYDEWLKTEIVEIIYDMEHKSIYQGTARVKPAVRFVLKIDGMTHEKKTRWMTFNYSENAYLYKTYIMELVANPIPFMKFDIDALKGMKIKTMWKANGEWDNLIGVRNISPKVVREVSPDEPPEEVDDSEPSIPF